MALYPFKDFVTTMKDGVSKALRISGYDEQDEMVKIKSTQQKWRSGFSGTTLNTDKWQLVQTGTGHTVSISNGNLVITTGTTINTETIIRTNEVFTIPVRVMFGLTLSQRIANQEIYFELVSTDHDTSIANNESIAGWLFDGTSATVGKYVTNGGAQSLLISGASTVPTTAGGSIFEIEPTADECWFFGRTADSTNGRANSYVRHSQIPDPNLKYKFQIRVKNLGTAPASSTTVTIPYVGITDYAEITAEITAGRGSSVQGQGIYATVGGTVSIGNTPTINANIYGTNTPYTDSTTNLGASALFTGTGRDAGASMLFNRFRVTLAHTAGVGHGHLYIQQSTDNATWRETHRIPIPSDGSYRTFEFPVNLRYVRVMFQNGATAQTQFFLSSVLVRMDGVFDMDKTISFTHSTTALGASATFTGVALNLGDNHSFNRHRAQVYSDQAGTAYLEESIDGTTWRVCAQSSVSAGATVTFEDLLVWKYVRIRYVNGATAQTAFSCTTALIRQ